MRKEFRKMRKDKINREEYADKKKEYKIWCDIERKRRGGRKEDRINKNRRGGVEINKHRRKRERIDENIEPENWNQHFRKLLEGTEGRG